MWQNPCDAPWIVYIETAFPAFLDLLISFASFGLSDIARGYFRPKRARTGMHGRKAKRSGKRKPKGIPEFGEKVGKNLPGYERVSARKVSQGVHTLWRIDGVIQRLLWWWLVIDVVSEFLFRWTSQLYATEYCEKAGQPALSAYTEEGGLLAITGWHGRIFANTDYNKGGFLWTGGSIRHPSLAFDLVVATQVVNIGEQAFAYTLAVSTDGTEDEIFAQTTSSLIEPGGSGECVLKVKMPPGKLAVTLDKIDAGFGEITFGQIVGMG